eukprot:gene327-261_t
MASQIILGEPARGRGARARGAGARRATGETGRGAANNGIRKEKETGAANNGIRNEKETGAANNGIRNEKTSIRNSIMNANGLLRPVGRGSGYFGVGFRECSLFREGAEWEGSRSVPGAVSGRVDRSQQGEQNLFTMKRKTRSSGVEEKGGVRTKIVMAVAALLYCALFDGTIISDNIMSDKNENPTDDMQKKATSSRTYSYNNEDGSPNNIGGFSRPRSYSYNNQDSNENPNIGGFRHSNIDSSDHNIMIDSASKKTPVHSRDTGDFPPRAELELHVDNSDKYEADIDEPTHGEDIGVILAVAGCALLVLLCVLFLCYMRTCHDFEEEDDL